MRGWPKFSERAAVKATPTKGLKTDLAHIFTRKSNASQLIPNSFYPSSCEFIA